MVWEGDDRVKLNGGYKIGFRAIKTAIAVFLCLVISFLLKKEDAFFSSIAAIICMQQTNDETFKAGLHRLVGTTLGGIIGYVVLEIISSLPVYYDVLNIFLIPACVLLVIYLCNAINKKSSVGIGCIVLVSILSDLDRSTQDTLLYVINRVIDTSIGIVIAMLVNRFLFTKEMPGRAK